MERETNEDTRGSFGLRSGGEETFSDGKEGDSESGVEYALCDLFGEKESRDEVVRYGELTLRVAAKEGKANTLLADHLFSPSLLLAERIERGLISLSERTVVELGAGCALPSLLASTLPEPYTPTLAVVTDHPSPEILSNLERNVTQNAHLAWRSGCRVACVGYEWGTDTSAVLHTLGSAEGGRRGFDVVIMSDLLHFDSSHAELVRSVVGLLGRHGGARVYAAAGKYTAWRVCSAFLAATSKEGIEWTGGDDEGDVWLGEMDVEGLGREELGVRKGNCWWWVGRWSE